MTYLGSISILNIPTSIITKIPILSYPSVFLREVVSPWKEDVLRKRDLLGGAKRNEERGKRQSRKWKMESGK
jgi:hypothetical protein